MLLGWYSKLRGARAACVRAQKQAAGALYTSACAGIYLARHLALSNKKIIKNRAATRQEVGAAETYPKTCPKTYIVLPRVAECVLYEGLLRYICRHALK